LALLASTKAAAFSIANFPLELFNGIILLSACFTVLALFETGVIGTDLRRRW
jgi:hypothetical protein